MSSHNLSGLADIRCTQMKPSYQGVNEESSVLPKNKREPQTQGVIVQRGYNFSRTLVTYGLRM
ncbi:hypothetical protein HanRHA438_Chr15g0719131 [Helianthus annuus]|nr:hypothetical protein HanRHA438_Chr15g0719131 [Helianthus annuus]